MTPDELRRMDNDLCIIFEKGIKPVKANKFYYFKHKKMSNDLAKVEISHNDIGEIQRGNWRKFNPYNPWTEDNNDKQRENLKVESLDDLFEDDKPLKEEKKEEKKENNEIKENIESKKSEEIQSIDDLFEENTSVENETKKATPQVEEEEDTYDLQKELEAKFDELFGPIDDE